MLPTISPIRAGVSSVAVVVFLIVVAVWFFCSVPDRVSASRIDAGHRLAIPQTTYFSQDFSSSTVVSDYVNAAAPGSGQFNSIGTSGAGMITSIHNAALRYERTGNSGSYSRTTDLAPVPTTLKYSFDLTVSGNTTAQTTAATFQVGSGFGTANSVEALANTFARFALNFTGTNGAFSLRELGTTTNSPNFSGTNKITWVLNNLGSGTSYVSPLGDIELLADDTADLWIGTTRVFNDYAITTPTQTMTDLKFVFAAGVGAIEIDNILVEDIQLGPSAALVSLSGRVTDASGRGIRNAIVILEGGGMNEPRVIATGSFGYYNFDAIETGVYMVSVSSRRFTFAIPSRVLSLKDNATGVDFVAEPQE